MDLVGNPKASAPNLRLIFARGEPFYAVLSLGTAPIDDILLWQVKMQVRERATGTLVLELSEAPRFVFDRPNQRISLSLTPEDTLLFLEAGTYDYDIRVRVPGANSSILSWGSVQVERWITREGD